MTREERTELNYTGIILAGGDSSRMGKEKGLIPWKGRTLVEHAIAVLAPVCENIIISANNDRYDSLGFRVVSDVYPGCGPMGGIFSALGESTTMNNMVIPTDTPFVTTEIYRYLIPHAGPYDVIVPLDHMSFFQPLCAVYAKTIMPAMKAQMDERILGFTPLFNKVKKKAVPFHTGLDFYQEKSFYNLNSPADLEAIS